MDAEVIEFLDHDDNDAPWGEDWVQKTQVILDFDAGDPDDADLPYDRWGAIPPGGFDPFRALNLSPGLRQIAHDSGFSTNEVVYFLQHPSLFDVDKHLSDCRIQGKRTSPGMPHLRQIINDQQ